MRCCGCHGEFPEIAGPTHRYMLSSPGCWAVYCEVLAREYESSAHRAVHRLTVDAYAVQHPGVDTPQARNSVGIHLSRMALIFGRGWPIERANDAMLAITAKKRGYPWLSPPADPGALTVQQVLAARDPAAHCAAVEAWARAVFAAWEPHHGTVYEWLRDIPG
ncbi:MAG: DUF5946 family protein [Terracidiphilus sp.]